MKILGIILAVTTALAFNHKVSAQSKVKVVEDSIKVYGNCVMCKRRIEKSLVEQKGVKMVDWNVSTKNLFIAYRPDKISEQQIHESIAKVGHDTEAIKAQDSVYTHLPFCCLFRDHDPHTSESRLKH